MLAVLRLALSAVSVFGTAPQPPAPHPPDIHFAMTPQPLADAMLVLARVTRNDVVYDLGSGDGRIVVLAAQKYDARDRVSFVEGDLFTADISKATVVTLWLSSSVNLRLEAKLKRELRTGTRIVSRQFPIGGWPPDRTVHVGDETLRLWTVP